MINYDSKHNLITDKQSVIYLKLRKNNSFTFIKKKSFFKYNHTL